MIFKHAYKDITNYDIIEYTERYSPRIVSPEYCDYVTWLAEGNIPEKISGDEFVTIVNDQVVVDPNKDAILEQRRWIDLRHKCDKCLDETVWICDTDPLATKLTEADRNFGLAWRDRLMYLKRDYPNIDDAEAEYLVIEADWMHWSLW